MDTGLNVTSQTSNNKEIILEIDNLVKHFSIKGSKKPLIAVNGVTLKFKKGGTFGLVGESGSGKSTVGRCIMRLIDITSGRVVFKGEDLQKIPKKDFRLSWRRKIQMVFQDPYDSLNPRINVEEIIGEPLKLIENISKDEIEENCKNFLNLVKLEKSHLKSYRHELTQGQQQRVGIARAIATNPDFVVLDEPITKLDVSVQAEILNLLKRLQNELGITYLYISHDLNTVKDFCHEVGVMYLGRIVEFGKVNQVFESPKHPYSRALLASVLHPDPLDIPSSFKLTGEIPSPIGLPSGCSLYSRCPLAISACKYTPQKLMDIGKGHFVECMLVQDGSLKSNLLYKNY